jgi:2-hydroxy-6-oxo-6-(2'-aminophenyl)hexa-2,4-dienoate hydrolase
MAFPTIQSDGASSRYLTVGAIDTHYVEMGDGPTLILVHGGGPGADSWGNWRGCILRYAKNFRVIAMDMPGFGLSAKPDPTQYEYSQASRNQHLVDFIDALGAGPVHLIGNSMGGATALGVTMISPESVNRLVLMGAAGLAIANPDQSHRAKLGAYDFTAEGMRQIMNVLTGEHYVIDEDLLKYRVNLTLMPGAREAIQAIKSNVLTYEKEALARIEIPSLVVGGKEDRIAVLARTYGYLEILRNSWGSVFPHCGHWVMMEAPEAFVTVTTDFLLGDEFGVRA